MSVCWDSVDFPDSFRTAIIKGINIIKESKSLQDALANLDESKALWALVHPLENHKGGEDDCPEEE
ncbi:MAG: hypothetical protein FJZ49_04140 [Candidatus Verstraetearchaeota archaeon]|nr:hypothetical protein [Candidatus Verstraetearchaeota archaeon]